MRVDNNGRPKLRGAPKQSMTNRLGDQLRVLKARDFVDPIEYAQNALRQEHALRLAQHARQKERS